MQSLLLIAVLSVTWLALCVFMWRLHRARRYIAPTENTSILIAYASQTGNAQAIAERCAQALNLSNTTNVISLNALTLEHLASIERILFVVSTYGDGEAPDNGSLFNKMLFKQQKKQEAKLDHTSKVLANLEYSVIALGDSTYPEFCAFGYQVNQAMLTAGAQALGDVIAVDNYEEQTTKLANITPDWIEIDQELTINPKVKSLQYWQLSQRKLLNPDCNDEKLLQLSFKSIGPCPQWQAGDLIDIQPQHPVAIVDAWLQANNFDGDTWLTYQGHQQKLKTWLLVRELPESCTYSSDELLSNLPYLHKRSYSVASISPSGQLELIVRLLEKDEAPTFGLASGYLSHYCQVGDIVEGQIRDVSSHHNIDHNKPIILIGAGSGLAGLKAQIAARNFIFNDKRINNKLLPEQQKAATWLIFGERHNDPQLPLNQQLNCLTKDHSITLSCAYSQSKLKENQTTKYVQDILLAEQSQVKQWIADGASIYVCGSLSGMGEGVQQALIDILGQSTLDELQQQQRYIRDVY
ncbi:flavodoxin domain-containing protein [Colwellia sp. E2M01]|uniref:flavodoxin domain-containing protein n=1 Tax=Colwellia sp. E2M01 TaxID=2841561 RepID=UPI001C09D47D|nr:flavodoxin domain-containing protein [Colwellia sp. E2M01]MBU2870923.1 flavodoxin domain-containing protein [Colwellia sp. E2M01]